MKLYYFAIDNGDGSVSIKWVREEHVEAVRCKSDEGDDGWWFADESLTSVIVDDQFLYDNPSVYRSLWTPKNEHM